MHIGRLGVCFWVGLDDAGSQLHRLVEFRFLMGLERIKWALDPNSPNEIYIGQRKLVRDWT